MKRATKYYIKAGFLLLTLGLLVACSGSCAQSLFGPKTLEKPADVDFTVCLSEKNETSYMLSWTGAENADGYTISVNGVPVEEPIEGYIDEYDLTSYVTAGAENTVEITALGDGKKYENSSTARIQCKAEIPTLGLDYKKTKNGYYEVSAGEAKKLENIVIPDVYNYGEVAVLAEEAIGNKMTAIYTKTNPYPKRIRLPKYLKKIGDWAFGYCTSLEEIIIPETATTWGERVFQGCQSLKNVVLPSTLNKIPCYTFRDCYSLQQIDLPETVTYIDGSAFLDCVNMKSVSLPKNLEYIGDSAFNGTTLQSVKIPDSVKHIGGAAFYSFKNENFETVEISDDIRLDYMGGNVFPEVSKWYQNQPDGYICFGNMLYKYKGEMPENTVITSFPAGITRIADSAFNGCKNLVSVTIPDGWETVGKGVFQGCSSLKTVILPDSLKRIEDYAFGGCSLTEITIPENVEYIGIGAFGKFKGKRIVLPNSVTEIGGSLFSGSLALEEVVLSENIETLPEKMFEDCKSLVSFRIPASVKKIDARILLNSGVESLIIPKSIEEMDLTAFSRCTALICYEGTEEDWNKINFFGTITEKEQEKTPPTYYYSEEEPALNEEGTAYDGNFWHYGENGEIVIWVK